MNFDISREARLFLLKTARASIRSKQNNEKFQIEPTPDGLDFKSGCFVTLHLRGRLRGCIGNFNEDTDITENVSKMACQAAFSDPRFGPLSKDELGMVEIEISVLSPMESTKAEEIEVGKHGIYIVNGFNRGVLLPQVAAEQDWDRETFLKQTCVKAGLPEGAWKDEGTKIYRFSAIVFSENHLI